MKPWSRTVAIASARAAFCALVSPLGLVAFFLVDFLDFLAFGVAVGVGVAATTAAPPSGAIMS